MIDKPRKPLRWIGSTLDDLREFPDEVQRVMGHALDIAQHGGKHADAKPLRGFGGAGVLEIVDDYDRDTYRVVYTVRFTGVVYGLHAFQKKSKTGIATPRPELDLVRRRLKAGRGGLPQMARRTEKAEALRRKVNDTRITPSSGNVFADLGLPDAEEALLKSRLAQRIAALIEKRRLTQAKAGAVLGIDQPKVSKLLRGRLAEFSTDRLLRFLTTLDQDVDIVIKAKPRSRRHGRLRVVAA